jgi:uncharacterized protein
MPEDLMRYDVLTQQALRGVVRAALRKVVKLGGLPGDHHFYIAFNTTSPGVRLSEALRQRYPREMTIVLQHQYWNLIVNEEEFEVELSFNDVPERLVIPFSAVKGFLDPSVQVGLQFETVSLEQGTASAAESQAQTPSAAPPLPRDTKKDKKENVKGKKADDEDKQEEPKIVSLDAFRKK